MSDESNPAVFVVEDECGAAAPGQPRHSLTGAVYQVLEGLKPGDLVVSFGPEEL